MFRFLFAVALRLSFNDDYVLADSQPSVECMDEMAQGPPAPFDLLVDYRSSPARGITTQRPRLSWSLTSTCPNVTSRAYQIRMADKWGADAWDSGRVDLKEKSVQVEYTGPQLEEGASYHWEVRWWSDASSTSPPSVWSDSGLIWTGISSWEGAEFIAAPTDDGTGYLRSQLLMMEKVQHASAYVSGTGWAELWINGEKAQGETVHQPSWSEVDKRLLYATYNITQLLNTQGENCVGVLLGGGWAKHFDREVSLRLVVIIHLVTGSVLRWTSGEAWMGAPGPVVSSDPLHGEFYNANKEQLGWNTVGFISDAAAGWRLVKTVKDPALQSAQMSSHIAKPIHAFPELLRPMKTLNPSGNVWVHDFGKMIAGWAYIRLNKCSYDTTVTIRYGETLCGDGPKDAPPSAPCAPLSTIDPTGPDGKSLDRFVCRGDSQDGKETYEPRFAIHGFRYVQIEGWKDYEIWARQVHSDVTKIGGSKPTSLKFEGSGAQLLEKIHEMERNTLLINFQGIQTAGMTDAGRAGWLGPAAATAQEAILNFWMPAFYSEWLRTLSDHQALWEHRLQDDCKVALNCTGNIADAVPAMPGMMTSQPDPSWGSGFVLLVDVMRRYYADWKLVNSMYEGIKSYAEFLLRASEQDSSGLIRFYTYGDWLQPGRGGPSSDLVGELSSSFSFLLVLRAVRDAAKFLGRSQDAQTFNGHLQVKNRAFRHAFGRPGTIGDSSQASLVLGLASGALNEDQAQQIVARLHALIEDGHHHPATGMLTTPLLLEELSLHGWPKSALDIVLQTTYPSWGYMATQGATGIWEGWEYPRTTAGTGVSTSHTGLASVSSWLYKYLVGLRLDESNGVSSEHEAAGWSRVIFSPELIEDHRVNAAEATIQTLWGSIKASWKKEPESLSMTLELPPNTKGVVRVPGPPDAGVLESGLAVNSHPACGIGRCWREVLVGSGKHVFRVSRTTLFV